MGGNQFTKAKLLGLSVPIVSDATRKKLSRLAKGRPVSKETRSKISKSRIRFLKEHPDQVPYLLNHYSKGPSYPESYWKGILDSNEITYSEQFRIGLYALDFALVEKKIDFEIDGDQHYLDERVVESDKRRNNFLENLGWKIIRVRWSEYTKLENKKQFVDSIICQLRA